VTKPAEVSRPARRAADHGAWFLVLPALIPILVLSVGPLLYGVLLAFTDAQSGRTEPTRWIGALNFQDLLHDTLFWESFRIGLAWAVGVTVPQFLLALGLALLLDQRLRLRWLARALAIVPWAMPEVVVGIMWRLVYHPDAGILNETLRDLGLGEGSAASPPPCPPCWSSVSGPGCRRPPSPCSPACRTPRGNCTRPPRSTAPGPGAGSAS
jgi:multiple sugar transport system permease protein